MKTIRNLGMGLLVVFTLAACAPPKPPQDLVIARASFEQARTGPAATLDPADLHSARQALDAAERSFDANGDTQETRDRAYVAVRKASLAEARARTIATTQQTVAVIAGMHAEEKSAVALTSAELGRTQQELATKKSQLATEQQRRADAEKRAAQAAADLTAIASVKQEETRGMVITLSGGVLFATNKSDLLPSAQVKLNEVANALIKQDSESKIVVEGHTDSQGSAAYNQELSQRRAQAVRDYLVTRGIAADRVTSQGFGLSRPIADNASPEGRANNRRVEIVVQPPPSKQ
jgi:outer membrane protein OmpA-like peptidoglycan-associated protein